MWLLPVLVTLTAKILIIALHIGNCITDLLLLLTNGECATY